ncbi:MAG TPA: FliH/SctL family protein [Gaiellales bacterium]|jgi:flagellar biosynthesis/type III secretory pathway protein FliH|nr:FliH/SctL family protein [Gaiellales bacterium]
MTTQPFVFEQLDAGAALAPGETARSRAAEIVAAAEASAGEIAATARERGYAEGHAAGLAAADEALASVRAAFELAAEGLGSARSEFVAAAELRAIELAIALAEKVMGAALAADPALVREVVGGALRRITDHDGIVIELHPDDVDLIGPWIGERKSTRTSIDVRAERRVGRGGCIVRTSEGEVDAQLPEQLAAAEELLREAFAARREG